MKNKLIEDLKLLKKQMYNFISKHKIVITMELDDVMSHFIIWLNHSDARSRGIEWSIPELIANDTHFKEDMLTNGGDPLEEEWDLFLSLVTKHSTKRIVDSVIDTIKKIAE